MTCPRRINRVESGVILLLCLIAFALANAGCKADPQTRWAVARETLTQTSLALTSANRSGVLHDEDFVATEPFIVAARGAITRAGDEISSPDGDKDAVTRYLDIAESTLRQLEAFTKKD